MIRCHTNSVPSAATRLSVLIPVGQVLRHLSAAAQGNCGVRRAEATPAGGSGSADSICGSIPVCPVRQTGSGGRPLVPTEAGSSCSGTRATGHCARLATTGKPARRTAARPTSIRGGGIKISKAGYEKTGAQLRVRVRKMKRGGIRRKTAGGDTKWQEENRNPRA